MGNKGPFTADFFEGFISVFCGMWATTCRYQVEGDLPGSPPLCYIKCVVVRCGRYVVQTTTFKLKQDTYYNIL
jgi:hypothetical protein